MKEFFKEYIVLLIPVIISMIIVIVIITLCIQDTRKMESRRLEYFTKELRWSKARYEVCRLRWDCDLFPSMDDQVRFEEWRQKNHPGD